MNLQEAYQTLGLSNDASLEDAKKKYKELSRKYHPDVNKQPDAETNFKKINQAYDRIKKGDEPEPQNFQQNPFNPFQNFSNNPFENFGFNPFSRNSNKRKYIPSNIELNTTISFKDSILGCKKDFTFNRKIKCNSCDGNGHLKLNNGCPKCNGKGQTTTVRGQMVFVQTCNQCHGKTSFEECKNCSSTGVLDSEATVSVTIPAGVVDGNILRLSGMGNYSGEFLGSSQNSDVHLYINVEQDPDFSIDGLDVISTLDISLLEALKGCNKTVKTVLGNKDIEIKPLSKNFDYVTIPNVGVRKKGNQKVILTVNYPDEVDDLINFLQNEK